MSVEPKHVQESLSNWNTQHPEVQGVALSEDVGYTSFSSADAFAQAWKNTCIDTDSKFQWPDHGQQSFSTRARCDVHGLSNTFTFIGPDILLAGHDP